MSLPAIAVRVLFAYLFLLLIVRVSGKRTIRQVTPLDFTAALILGDLVDDLFWGEVPAAQFVVAAGVLLSLAVAVTLGPTLTPALGRLLNGAPTEVIRDGDWVRGGLRKERMAETDVLALLRQQGVRDLREVRSACVETDGQLGVIRRDWGMTPKGRTSCGSGRQREGCYENHRVRPCGYRGRHAAPGRHHLRPG